MGKRSKSELTREIVESLPCGKVVTYGDVSMQVYSHPSAGRAVGQTIRANEDVDGFPWWRVVYADWRPKRTRQKSHLQREKVTFDADGRVNPQHRLRWDAK